MKSPKRTEHSSIQRLTSMKSHSYAWPTLEISPNQNPDLHARELKVFEAVLSTQEKFSKVHLILAAKFAQATIGSDQVWSMIQEEGYQSQKEGRSGLIKVKNPLLDVHSALVSDLIRYSQKLGLSYAAASDGDPRTRANAAKANPARLSRDSSSKMASSDGEIDWVKVAQSEGVK